jgi:hypothetical protein
VRDRARAGEVAARGLGAEPVTAIGCPSRNERGGCGGGGMDGDVLAQTKALSFPGEFFVGLANLAAVWGRAGGGLCLARFHCPSPHTTQAKEFSPGLAFPPQSPGCSN